MDHKKTPKLEEADLHDAGFDIEAPTTLGATQIYDEKTKKVVGEMNVRSHEISVRYNKPPKLDNTAPAERSLNSCY